MNTKFVSDYVEDKLSKNDDIVTFTFFELRVKSNLSEEDTETFLELCLNKFTNMGYKVYFTGQRYIYEGEEKIVQDNELMVAVR